MKFPRSLEITFVIAREALRALAVPLHVCAYLLSSTGPRDQAMRALTAPCVQPVKPDAAARKLAAGTKTTQRHVFLSAGEASGEAHGVSLISALSKEGANPRWTCFGGERLEATKATLLFPLAEQAIMGIGGALKGLPIIVRAFASYLRLLDEDRPDMVILIDYPGLHLVMAAAARRRSIPVLHYIAPQYWAWAPWRVRRYRNAVDHCFTILPFEVNFFAAQGIEASYIGNPILDGLPATNDQDRDPGLLCILPGSRNREINEHLPGMLAVAAKLRASQPSLKVVLPHRDPRRHDLIAKHLQAAKADFVEFHRGEIHEPLSQARVVVAKSGTGSLESCLLGTPTVVIFVVKGWLHRFVLRYLLNVPWFASANLIAGRRVVPELALTEERDWTLVSDRVAEFLQDGEARANCLKNLADMRHRLGETGASKRAAQWLLPYCQSGTP